MKHFRMSLRCIEGRTVRHDPQNDDPELQTDLGECRHCRGAGCIPPAVVVAEIAEATT